MIGFLIALLSGTLMSIQGIFNTNVTKTTSIWVASTFVQLLALIVCVGIWAVADRTSFALLLKVELKYMLIGGAIGAAITYTVIRSVALLGPAKSAMLIVIAQILVSYIIELIGWFQVDKQPFEWRKVIGLFIAIAGIVLFKYEK